MSERTISFALEQRSTLESVLRATGHMDKPELYAPGGPFDLMLTQSGGNPIAIDYADAFAQQCDHVVLMREGCGASNFLFTMPSMQKLRLLGCRNTTYVVILHDWESPELLLKILEAVKTESRTTYDAVIGVAKRKGYLPL